MSCGCNVISPVTTNPVILNNTSTALLPINLKRSYLLIQNNSVFNLGVSLTGATLTGSSPSSTNPCIQIVPGASYESPHDAVTGLGITGYQDSGITLSNITVVEG